MNDDANTKPATPAASAIPLIGYATIEQLAARLTRGTIVYVNATTKLHRGQPVDRRVWHVDVQAIQATPPGHCIHYVCFPLGSVDYLYSKLFDPAADPDKVSARCDDCLAIVEEWLTEQGLRPVRASVAMPAGYELLHGWADFLEYDRQSERIARTPASMGSAGEHPIAAAIAAGRPVNGHALAMPAGINLEAK